jgi:hypothetical protein
MALKLIYISFARLTEKVARDWYIDHSIKSGATVEYWDIVALLRKEYEDQSELATDYLRHIKTYEKFEEFLHLPENQKAVYIVLISYSGFFSKPLRMLSRHNCKMVFFNWGSMPSINTAPRFQRIIKRFLTNPVSFFKLAADKSLGILYRRLNVVKRFDLVFVAGHELANKDQYAKKVVAINYFDYDQYKKIKLSNKKIIKSKYAVFLDQNLPNHPDFNLLGMPTLNSNNYYSSLDRFFTLIEELHRIKIVIGLHPSANDQSENFNGRETYKMHIAELVKDAEFLILHCSNSVSYAVLNYKPTVFIYSDEIKILYKETIACKIEQLASYLDANIYNLDQITDGQQVKIMPPNKKCYNSYKYRFLTSHDSETMTSAEIFWSEINSL